MVVETITGERSDGSIAPNPPIGPGYRWLNGDSDSDSDSESNPDQTQ